MRVHRQIQQNRQHMYTHNTKVHLHNNCCCGKATNISYSECVPVTFVIQHAKGKHHIIYSFVTWLALKLSHKGHNFWKKVQKTCALFFIIFIYNLSKTILFQRSFEFDFIKTAHTSSCKVFLSHFSETPIILTDFQKILIKFHTFQFNENVSSGSWVATLQRDFFMTLTAKPWSVLSDSFFFISITFPNPPSPKSPIGWKLSIESFAWVVLTLLSVWPETQSFNVSLRHKILYRIYTCCNYNTIRNVFVVVVDDDDDKDKAHNNLSLTDYSIHTMPCAVLCF